MFAPELSYENDFLVRQKFEAIEAFTGFETENKYEIFNNRGDRILYARENTDCCTRWCLGKDRPFDIMVENNMGVPIFLCQRPCTCCNLDMRILTPDGTTQLAKVHRNLCSICRPVFTIKDGSGVTQLKIRGPFCIWPCFCMDVKFQVLSAKDTNVQIGTVAKVYKGTAREVFTDANNFSVQMPLDLDNRLKAALIGASLLIDFLYFEK